jgi:hypothetical protein
LDPEPKVNAYNSIKKGRPGLVATVYFDVKRRLYLER